MELKHGRVAMFATIGYILPEYWRFPGYLSKFLDVKFADVPNGLSAFSKARRGCFEARKRPGTGPNGSKEASQVPSRGLGADL